MPAPTLASCRRVSYPKSQRIRKAIFTAFGPADNIRIVDVDPPRPETGEIIVRVAAAALNPKDVLIRKGKFKLLGGRKTPQGIGYDFAGTVHDANGSDLEVGQRVFGMINGFVGRTCAEFVNVDRGEVYALPEGLSFREAAGMPLVGQTALQALRDRGELKPGGTVLINGASGGVGTVAIQLAKILGATVTTTSSDSNVGRCITLGADRALDYRSTKLVELEDRFDVFFDVFGNYAFGKVDHLLTERGRYVTTVPGPPIFVQYLQNPFRKKQAKMVVVNSNTGDLAYLADLLATGALEPVVDRVFALDEVADAQRYLETKRARGKVIVEVTSFSEDTN